MCKTNMSVEPFLGFRKITASSNWSKKQQLPDFINLLFLAVFACAWMYLPYSEAVSKKYQKHMHAMKASDIVFSTPTQAELKGPKQKIKLAATRKRENQKMTHYFDDPLCQFSWRAKTQSLNPSPNTQNSRLEACKSARIFSKEQDVENRPNKQSSRFEEKSFINPNANHGPATLRMRTNPNTQVHSIAEFVNPNSFVIIEKLAHPLSDEKKGLVQSTPIIEGEKTKTHQQQNPPYRGKTTRIKSKSTLLNTPILDIPGRISELYDSNQKLEKELRDRDALLQEKDNLIIGIQTQLMSYEYMLENTAGDNFIHESTRLTQLKKDQRKELYQLKKEWMEKKLQQEKRIGSLLSALKVEKERMRILQSTGADTLISLKNHNEQWSNAAQFVDKNPGKLISPNQVLSDNILPSSQKMKSKSPMLSSSRKNVQDVEMEDETIKFLADTDTDGPTTAEEVLGKRHFGLKSQISESSKTSEGLFGEMSDLEYVNLQQNCQRDQELGETMMSNTNTQSTQTQPGQRVGKTRLSQRKMFNLPKFFSGKKLNAGEIWN